jgi:hypothetical protein
MPESTSKTFEARCWVVLGALLLAGVLAIQCQPQVSVRATNDLVRTTGPFVADNGTVNPQPGGQSNAAAGRRPVVIIYEMNPWLQVIGSDSPSFALYEDGLVIFGRPAAGGGSEYASAKIGTQELDSLVRSLPIKQFFELEPRYETTLATDQPTTVINLWDGDGLKRVSVYGGLKRTDNDRKEGAPAAFVEVYEKLKGLRPAGASLWTPEKVELMIWPYDSAGEIMPWPKGWPDTKHPETKKRGDDPGEISYSIYLSWRQYQVLKGMAKARHLDALFIDGRKWAFSFRFPFPGEDSWRKNKG